MCKEYKIPSFGLLVSKNNCYSECLLNEQYSLPFGSFYHLKFRTWGQLGVLLANKSWWSFNNSFRQKFYPKSRKMYTLTLVLLTYTKCTHTPTVQIHTIHIHTLYTHIHIHVHAHFIHAHPYIYSHTSKLVGVTSVFYILSIEFSQVTVATFLQKMRDRSRMVSH